MAAITGEPDLLYGGASSSVGAGKCSVSGYYA